MEEKIEIKQAIVRKLLFRHLANLANYPITNKCKDYLRKLCIYAVCTYLICYIENAVVKTSS